MAITYPASLPEVRTRTAVTLDTGQARMLFDSGHARQRQLFPEAIRTWRYEFVVPDQQIEAWFNFMNAAAWESAGVEIEGDVVIFIDDPEQTWIDGDAWLMAINAVTLP